MKRFISILFLVLVLLNAVGYYGLLFIAQQQFLGEGAQAVARNGVDMNGDMIFRIPLSLPYAGNSGYVATAGQLMHEGKLYQAVKQKRYNDTLYIVCMLDSKSTLLNDMLSRCTRSFSNEAKDPEGGMKIVLPASKYYLLTSYSILRQHTDQPHKHAGVRPDAPYLYHGSFEIFQPPQLSLPAITG